MAKRPATGGESAAKNWRPNPGPQERFVECATDEALFGGAAGPGKSFALLYLAMRHVDAPGYRALLLRRTFPELRRSLIEDARTIYKDANGIYNESATYWRFPSGAKVEFGALDHDRDVHKYQSAQYAFIGFDELTTFTEFQFTYMSSRNRNTVGLPNRLRAATNPGGVGHDWVLARYAPWLYPHSYTKYKGARVRPGQVLHYKWNDSRKKEVITFDPTGTTRAYFPARVGDNPYLAGTSYEKQLDKLDPLTRARLKHGDWMARPAAGIFFKRDWLEVVPHSPPSVEIRVRYWDRAASTSTTSDFTAGVRLARAGGVWYVEDVVHFRGTPFEVETRIEATAKADAALGTMLILEQDPAAAGLFEKRYYLQKLAKYGVRFARPMGDKIIRASVPSAQAEARNIKLVDGAWNEEFINELQSFPDGHDDQVDGLSGGMRVALIFLEQDMANVGVGTVSVDDPDPELEPLVDADGNPLSSSEEEPPAPPKRWVSPESDEELDEDGNPIRPQPYQL